MKVFISWSGDQSKRVALALRDWLPMVIQAVQPYMSEQDNDAGVRWLDTVSNELEGANFGIVCVTPDNVNSRWLNFEAGAISKAVDKARVVPLLYGFLSLADVPPPLGQFQAKMADEQGIRSIVATANALIDNPRPESQLASIFRALWPDLKSKLEKVSVNHAVSKRQPRRPDRELLEELLQLARKNDGLLIEYDGLTLPGLITTDDEVRGRWLISGLQELFGSKSVHPLGEDQILITNLPEVPSMVYDISKALGFEIVPNTPTSDAV